MSEISQITMLNGAKLSTPINAYGPFVAPNGAEYWLAQCGFMLGRNGEFVVVDRIHDFNNVWIMGNEPDIHYSFAMACINLLNLSQEQPI